jgi:hypothetical protein
MPVRTRIADLVAALERNLEAYDSGAYNEAQVRREFIEPFFEALGWDVENRQGFAAAYQDVIHEDAIKVGGATEAPDYCFRVGGTRTFFVEAKKPSINIGSAVHPAFQLRRHGAHDAPAVHRRSHALGRDRRHLLEGSGAQGRLRPVRAVQPGQAGRRRGRPGIPG